MDGFKVIPQIFYDLMARIIPGVIAILAFTSAAGATLDQVAAKLFQNAPKLSQSSFVLATTFLLVAYLIGHLLSPFIGLLIEVYKFTTRYEKTKDWRLLSKSYSLLERAWSKVFPSFPQALEKTRDELCTLYLRDRINSLVQEAVYGAGPPGQDTKLDIRHYCDALYIWYDWLRIRKPDLGERLTKLRAEYHMLEGITHVLLIAFVIHFVACAFSKTTLSMYLAGSYFFGFILSGRAAAKQCWTFQWSTINHYLLVVSEGALNEKPSVDSAGASQRS